MNLERAYELLSVEFAWDLPDAEGADQIVANVRKIPPTLLHIEPETFWDVVQAVSDRDTDRATELLAYLEEVLSEEQWLLVQKETDDCLAEGRRVQRLLTKTEEELEAEAVLVALTPNTRESRRFYQERALLLAMARKNPWRAMALQKAWDSIGPPEARWRLWKVDREAAIFSITRQSFFTAEIYWPLLLQEPTALHYRLIKYLLETHFLNLSIRFNRILSIFAQYLPLWPLEQQIDFVILLIDRVSLTSIHSDHYVYFGRGSIRRFSSRAACIALMHDFPEATVASFLEQLLHCYQNVPYLVDGPRKSLRRIQRALRALPFNAVKEHWLAVITTARQQYSLWSFEERYRKALQTLTATENATMPTIWTRRLQRRRTDPDHEALRRRMVVYTARVLERHG